jgi:hypothetical protein
VGLGSSRALWRTRYVKCSSWGTCEHAEEESLSRLKQEAGNCDIGGALANKHPYSLVHTPPSSSFTNSPYAGHTTAPYHATEAAGLLVTPGSSSTWTSLRFAGAHTAVFHLPTRSIAQSLKPHPNTSCLTLSGRRAMLRRSTRHRKLQMSRSPNDRAFAKSSGI